MDLKKVKKDLINQLRRMNIEYEILNLKDDDINFYLHINAKDFFKEYEEVGKIGTLMYVKPQAETLNILCTNLYRECNQESLLKVISVINSVNNCITYGKVFADQKGTIIYQNAVPIINNIINIEKYLRAFLMAIWVFYCEMKKIEEVR